MVDLWYDNEITQGILKKKYLHEGEKTIHDLINRVSSIYSKDIKDDVKTALYNADICPAGRILYGAGMKGKARVSLSNCYVVNSPEDTLKSICDVDYQISRIGSMGGGVGIALDNIRPKGSKINNSAKISDGVSFALQKYNQTGNIVGQNTRHMAMMLMLSCDHPDIEEFVNIKKNDEKLSAMNISIKFTDEFMTDIVENNKHELSFTVEASGEKINKTINARDFFKDFCEVNADYGEPCAVFIDKVRNYNLLSGYENYKIDVSNPCAEFFGNSGNSCNLESVNLYNIVDNKFTKEASISYNKLEKLVRLGVNMLNQSLDYGYDMQPLEVNRKCIDEWRSIGLGVFGLADMFIALGVKYGSKESIEYVSDIFDFINIVALDESSNLAKEYGTFGMYNWDKTEKSPLIQALRFNNINLFEKIKKYGLRNGTLISIAPTGTISLFMGGYSGGCEPLFKIGYERTTHSTEDSKKHFRVFAKSIKDLLEFNKVSLDLPDAEIKKLFPYIVESHEVDPMNRIAIQSIMQEYVDNAISSTINLPNSATAKDIYDIYIHAWEQGLKGVTVFRDGCKRGNILGVDTKKKEQSKESTPIAYNSIEPESRRNTEEVAGKTYKMRSACAEKIYVTVNKTDGDDIFEVFVNPSGGCTANVNTIGRLVSMALRSGIKVDTIIDELSTSKCPACQALRRKGEKDVSLSCGNAIAEALRKAYYDKPVVHKQENEEEGSCASCKNTDCPSSKIDKQEQKDDGLMKCPDCGERTLRLEAKCATCSNCGFSLCN